LDAKVRVILYPDFSNGAKMIFLFVEYPDFKDAPSIGCIFYVKPVGGSRNVGGKYSEPDETRFYR
jgi:hypothetical protein